MNEIKVKTEMCEKDRELISDLTRAIVQLTIQLKGNSEAADHYGKCFGVEAEVDAFAIDAPLPELEPEAPEAPAGEEAPKITQEDIRQKYVALSASGKKAPASAIIKKYANKVSEIPEKDYKTVLDQLIALEG